MECAIRHLLGSWNGTAIFYYLPMEPLLLLGVDLQDSLYRADGPASWSRYRTDGHDDVARLSMAGKHDDWEFPQSKRCDNVKL